VHPDELITMMVVEEGFYVLENGAMVEAACFPASGASSFSSVTFQQTMHTPPVVLAAIGSVNEPDAAVVRLKNISASGFEFKIQEQEANSASHAEETVCYVAWEQSMGSMGAMQFEVAATDNSITSSDAEISYLSRFTEIPFVLAGQQTTEGGNTAVLSVKSSTMETLTVSVSEEQSRDSEINHIGESAGYIALSSNEPDSDPDGDGLTTEDEDWIYGTDPLVADTDRDGISDGDEVDFWLNTGSSWDSDIDGDGLINLHDADADGDEMSDGDEIDAGFDPSDPTDPGAPEPELVLTVNPYKVRWKKSAELTWSGATSGKIDIYRNGRLTGSTDNSGIYTDGPFYTWRPVTYQVCEANTIICSNEVTASW